MTLQGLRFPHETRPGPGAALEIAPGVLWARMPLPMKLDHVNVYALDDGDGWSVVDTGFDTPQAREHWQMLLAGPLSAKPVTRIVVTHYHPDHIGLAGWLMAQTGATLWTTRTSWLFARMLTLDVQDRPTPETLAFWRAAGMDAAMLDQRAHERPFNFADVVSPLPLGYRRIKAGDVVTIGGRAWDVRIGHGHAPEHAVLFSRDDHLVIGGDQLLPGISANLGVYATEPEADPVGEWLASCESLLPFARPEHLVLPGHKLPFTGLPLRLQQMIDNHHGALLRLRAAVDSPKRASDCFGALFGREIGAGEYGLALVEAVAHLNHLLALGEVTRARGTDGAWWWKIA